MSVKVISEELLAQLNASGRQSSRARQHLNLHANHSEPSQRLLNAVGVSSYIRPHRHALDPKTESLFALRGAFALVVFDESGGIEQVTRFATEKYTGGGVSSLGVELSPGTWHTVLALIPDSVLLEIKAGPFDPGAAKELAAWAPEEGTSEAVEYHSSLRRLVDTDHSLGYVGKAK